MSTRPRTTRTGDRVARFDLAMPADIRFGAGRVGEVPAALTALGASRVLVVTGRDSARAADVRAALSTADIATEVFAVAAEPSIDLVRAAVAATADAACDAVVGIGGGSALDSAKAAAVLATTRADPLDHLEVIGAGRPITEPGLPCVAVPTTAGTGSEVTRNAVLAGDGVKASLRSPRMLPAVAVVDPADRRAPADHRGQRDGRAVPAGRAAAVGAGQPVHRRPGPRRHPPLGPVPAPGVRRGHDRSRRTRGPRPGQPVRRTLPGQLRPRRRPTTRRSPGWPSWPPCSPAGPTPARRTRSPGCRTWRRRWRSPGWTATD